MNATYLFQQDKHYDVFYDTGDKTIQCGRHIDVFKVWLMWRAKVINLSWPANFIYWNNFMYLKNKGDVGFENQVDKLFDLASFLYNQVKMRKNFEIVLNDVK